MLRPVLAVSLANLVTLPTRLGACLVVVLGVAGVVFVLTALLAMAHGLEETLRTTGSPDRVLMLGRGSRSEINGSITREQAGIIATKPGVARAVLSDDRTRPLASAEIYATANLPRRDGSGRAGLPLRGVGEMAFAVRDEVEIVEGRTFQSGRFELVVGAGAARTFAGLEVGASVPIKGVEFVVVGRFESGGRATESEAWLDVDVMANVFRRGPFLQSVLVRLEGTGAFEKLSEAIAADRRLAVDLFPEAEFYVAQSESATSLMRLVAVTAGAIMALGAVFGALNSIHTAVAARTREIAILRAIGYGPAPIVVSVLAESLALAVAGGVLGIALGWLVFDGRAMASVGTTYSEVAFQFVVTPSLAFGGLALAVAVGALGGLPPALAAARRPVVEGLRAA